MRNYRLDSQLITTQLRNGVHGVFGEDEEMLTAQQNAIDANPDYEFYSLNIDAGGMWVRRLIERQLAAEGRLIPTALTRSPAIRRKLDRQTWLQRTSKSGRSALWSRRGHRRTDIRRWSCDRPGPMKAEPGSHIDVQVSINGEQRHALLLHRGFQRGRRARGDQRLQGPAIPGRLAASCRP